MEFRLKYRPFPMTDANLEKAGGKITVIFLLYSEAKYVPGLFAGILRQRHPVHSSQTDWMEVMFVDNGSKDDTLQVIQAELARAGSPSNYQIVHIPQNVGIARAMNHAFSLVKTPYVLTCHCDVLFGSDDYAARMRDLLASHSDAGAIAGQPDIPRKERIPFAEKLNLITNLMDIFPPVEDSSRDTLTPVGFVEGRCDGFRLEALKVAGCYDTTLKLAGEDQVLAARMRQQGFQIYQAPALRYMLSVSSDQDSLLKLARHQRLFGRAHPYIVLMNRKAVSGIAGKSAGGNRQARTILRLSQVFSTLGYLAALICLVLGQWVAGALVIALIALAKQILFNQHMRAVSLSVGEWFQFWFMQPLLDVSYTIGLLNGVWLLLTHSKARPIT